MKPSSRPPSKPIRSPAQLGQFIRQKRKALGLSQTELAAQAGIGQPALSEFENDPRKSGIETAFQILMALGFEIRCTALPNTELAGTTSDATSDANSEDR